MSEGQAFRILFVCTGNTCRSPMAEALARAGLAERGWSGVEVKSAGIAAAPGQGASEATVRVTARHGLDVAGHRTAPLTPELVDWADLILTMAPGHLAVTVAAGGAGRAAVITAFAEGGVEGEGVDEGAVHGGPGMVPDPFGGDDEEYEATYHVLSGLVERVLDRLAPVVSP